MIFVEPPLRPAFPFLSCFAIGSKPLLPLLTSVQILFVFFCSGREPRTEVTEDTEDFLAIDQFFEVNFRLCYSVYRTPK